MTPPSSQPAQPDEIRGGPDRVDQPDLLGPPEPSRTRRWTRPAGSKRDAAAPRRGQSATAAAWQPQQSQAQPQRDQPERARPDAEAQPAVGSAIATRGLTKQFRSGQLAVDNLSLEVPLGSVYGFLGPNGSGKTTTIRMLLGLVQPTSGSHRLLDVAMPDGAAAVLPRVGSLVEGPAFYPFLSGQANLARCDAADRTADPATAAARIGAALDRVGLTAAAQKHYRAYSLGMKQRLAIAAGLLRPRDLMILDEPTNGLDPQGTREVRGLIRQIAAEGTTVFVSSHLLAEVEQICSHVGVMRAGQLAFEGTLEDLRGRDTPRISVATADTVLAAKVLAQLGLADIQPADGRVSAQLGSELPEDICAQLVHAGVRVAGLETRRASLEDLFVQLTGEGFDVNG